MDEIDHKDRVPLTERIALSPDDASAVSGIGVTRIRAAAACDALEAHRHGRRVIILRDSLIAWIKSMPKAAHTKVPHDREMEANKRENAIGVLRSKSQALDNGGAVGRNGSPKVSSGALGRKARMQTRVQRPVKKVIALE